MAHRTPRDHRIDPQHERGDPGRGHPGFAISPRAARESGQRPPRTPRETAVPGSSPPRCPDRAGVRGHDLGGGVFPARALGGRAWPRDDTNRGDAHDRLPRRDPAAPAPAVTRCVQLRLLRAHPEPVRGQPVRQHARRLPGQRPVPLHVARLARNTIGLRAGVRVDVRRDHGGLPIDPRRDRGVPRDRGRGEPGLGVVRDQDRRSRAAVEDHVCGGDDRTQPRRPVPYRGRRSRRRARHARRVGRAVPDRDRPSPARHGRAHRSRPGEGLRCRPADPADRLRREPCRTRTAGARAGDPYRDRRRHRFARRHPLHLVAEPHLGHGRTRATRIVDRTARAGGTDPGIDREGHRRRCRGERRRRARTPRDGDRPRGRALRGACAR